MKQLIGILGQGNFTEHQAILKRLKVKTILVTTPKDLENITGFIIAGGQSTAMSVMIEKGLRREIIKKVKNGLKIFGVCAGAILLSKRIEQDFIVEPLNLMDVVIKRNAYKEKKFTFNATIKFNGKEKRFKAVLLDAPFISQIGKKVKILYKLHGSPMLVRQKNVLISTFHTEIEGYRSTFVHDYFLKM